MLTAVLVLLHGHLITGCALSNMRSRDNKRSVWRASDRDCDGTTVPSHPSFMPSPGRAAVARARHPSSLRE